ncbi:MAG: hypothetical protein SNI51_08945 [Rikenellaceae bacterium]
MQAFIQVYLYQIESLINSDPKLLDGVSFQSEEANTDSELKEFFKTFILANNSLTEEYLFNVEIIGVDKVAVLYAKEDLCKYKIERVYLPSELTNEHKVIIKSEKRGVYTNPDIFILVSDGSEHKYVSSELKSTKSDKIPGSSVQQVSPYEWVIFVQHMKEVFRVTTGQYLNSITSVLPFPDRSPRPQIGFNILDGWNSRNRVVDKEKLTIDYSKDDNTSKLSILENWHGFLVNEWLTTVCDKDVSDNEKWFNHTIRLYSLALVEHYNSLSDEARVEFVKRLIEKTKL